MILKEEFYPGADRDLKLKNNNPDRDNLCYPNHSIGYFL